MKWVVKRILWPFSKEYWFNRGSRREGISNLFIRTIWIIPSTIYLLVYIQGDCPRLFTIYGIDIILNLYRDTTRLGKLKHIRSVPIAIYFLRESRYRSIWTAIFLGVVYIYIYITFYLYIIVYMLNKEGSIFYQFPFNDRNIMVNDWSLSLTAVMSLPLFHTAITFLFTANWSAKGKRSKAAKPLLLGVSHHWLLSYISVALSNISLQLCVRKFTIFKVRTVSKVCRCSAVLKAFSDSLGFM